MERVKLGKSHILQHEVFFQPLAYKDKYMFRELEWDPFCDYGSHTTPIKITFMAHFVLKTEIIMQ